MYCIFTHTLFVYGCEHFESPGPRVAYSGYFIACLILLQNKSSPQMRSPQCNSFFAKIFAGCRLLVEVCTLLMYAIFVPHPPPIHPSRCQLFPTFCSLSQQQLHWHNGRRDLSSPRFSGWSTKKK
eukprot:RCo019468